MKNIFVLSPRAGVKTMSTLQRMRNYPALAYFSTLLIDWFSSFCRGYQEATGAVAARLVVDGLY